MVKNNAVKMMIWQKAIAYLKKNPERFNADEKEKFKISLIEFLNTDNNAIADEIYDFLVAEKIVWANDRTNEFASYVNGKFSPFRFKRVLDVGAGRICKLSEKLTKKGYSVTSVDPKIRLSKSEAKGMHIQKIEKTFFECDDFAKNGQGYDVSDYDLIVGLEPCEATEHIIRQALKYKKAFAVLLCATNHSALNGKQFKTSKQWYKYLLSISENVDIVNYNGSFILTNTVCKENQKEI